MTKTWTLNVDEVVQDALARVGGNFINADEARQARRSLNILLKELLNRGVPLSAIRQYSFTLSEAVSTYSLPLGVIDVLSANYLSSGIEYPLQKISFQEYQLISNKETLGRPTLYTVNRTTGITQVRLWPVFDGFGEPFFRYYAIEEPNDVNTPHQTIDLPRRYLPAVIAGLTYMLSQKRGVSIEKLQFFKNEYLEQLQLAFDEDRERTSMFIVPRLVR